MNTDNLYFKSKLANKLLKDVNELFHFQKTIDWEAKAKERILLDFIKVEKRAEERRHEELDPFVSFALWVLQNRQHQWFNNVEIGQENLDKIKIMCGYSTD